jgi:hypothetical protein
MLTYSIPTLDEKVTDERDEAMLCWSATGNELGVLREAVGSSNTAVTTLQRDLSSSKAQLDEVRTNLVRMPSLSTDFLDSRLPGCWHCKLRSLTLSDLESNLQNY